MPNSLIVLIEIFVIVCTVYILQRFIMNVGAMISKRKAKKQLDKYRKYKENAYRLSGADFDGDTVLLGDLGSTKKEKTTSEKDEDLNGSDDPDIDDFLK